MATIEVQSFFYDLIHCKDKILTSFDKFDQKYGEDERGALVAGIREASDSELINLLINIQRLATGFQEIHDLITEAEQKEVDDAIAEIEGGDDDDDDF